MSRLEAGPLRPALEWVSSADVVAEVLDRLEPVLNGRQIGLDLPEPSPVTPLDFVLVTQVLTNLFDNARRYSPRDALISISAACSTSSIGLAPNRRVSSRTVDCQGK
jgi:two-component system sensor histidine kinase KdpD